MSGAAFIDLKIYSSWFTEGFVFEGERSPTCEAGWEQHGGKCYYFSTSKSSWTDSRRSCSFSSTSPVQMFLESRLRDLMEDAEDRFWIGLTDSVEEGRWFWVDGSALDQRFASADCARMSNKIEAQGLKSWFDISCNYPLKSICEKQLD
uniref:C-type lectin domain-containing protein n=1 Tax=Poecilia mexicana TaxID=48701 RepID=A0A3B3YUQ7_9TELE